MDQDSRLLPELKTFLNNARMYARVDEEFRANWRYKHKQESLKASRRQYFNAADASSAKLATTLLGFDTSSFLISQTKKAIALWQGGLEYKRIYLDNRTADTLADLRSAEKKLKDHIAQLTIIIQKNDTGNNHTEH